MNEQGNELINKNVLFAENCIIGDIQKKKKNYAKQYFISTVNAKFIIFNTIVLMIVIMTKENNNK